MLERVGAACWPKGRFGRCGASTKMEMMSLGLRVKAFGKDGVRLLIAAGGSLTDTDANGATPLALAAFCGQAEVTTLLVGKEGVDVECTDNSGATPLWLASAAGHDEVVRVLLAAGARPDVSSGGKPALVAATRIGLMK